MARNFDIIDWIMENCETNECMGLCLACGEEAYGVKPDARGWKCEECGEREVYGAEELLVMM